MAGMILHLIRHPEPEIEAGVCYGRLDIPAKNVEAAAERLRADLPPGLPVFTSPLLRCSSLAGLLHPQPIVDDRLAEMHFGDWEGRRWDDIPRHQLDAWAADIAGYAPPGGESPAALQRRAQAFVTSLDGPEAVVVTHGGVIRVLQAYWKQLPFNLWGALIVPYGSITTVKVSPKQMLLGDVC
jgi:alpha-ribazole phosphatase